MHSVESKRIVDFPHSRVWAAIEKPSSISNYHPLLDHSPVEGVDGEVGDVRVCHFSDGNVITERVTQYDRGEGYVVELTDFGKFPLSFAEGGIHAKPLDGNRTEVTFTLKFKARYGLLGKLLGHFMMVPQFQKLTDSILESLELHIQTGKPIGKDGVFERVIA